MPDTTPTLAALKDRDEYALYNLLFSQKVRWQYVVAIFLLSLQHFYDKLYFLSALFAIPHRYGGGTEKIPNFQTQIAW